MKWTHGPNNHPGKYKNCPICNPKPTKDILRSIRPGDRVTVNVPAGIGRSGVEYKKRTGRAVMRGPAGWVLNMGGKYGTPGVATLDNVVRVERRRNVH